MLPWRPIETSRMPWTRCLGGTPSELSWTMARPLTLYVVRGSFRDIYCHFTQLS